MLRSDKIANARTYTRRAYLPALFSRLFFSRLRKYDGIHLSGGITMKVRHSPTRVETNFVVSQLTWRSHVTASLLPVGPSHDDGSELLISARVCIYTAPFPVASPSSFPLRFRYEASRKCVCSVEESRVSTRHRRHPSIFSWRAAYSDKT